MNGGTGPAKPRVVLAGVAGCGKTTVGRLLADQLGVPFVDADDFHPVANRARMAAGVPLDDAARAGWLSALHAHLLTHHGAGFVLACSALRARYRQTLAAGLPPFAWVQLRVDATTLQARLAQRRDHFFPPGLLASQLATWEDLADGLVLDGTAAPATLVTAIAAWLGPPPRTFTPG